MLTSGDVARRLGISTERVRQLEREGILPAERTAGPRSMRIFREEDVERVRRDREEHDA